MNFKSTTVWDECNFLNKDKANHQCIRKFINVIIVADALLELDKPMQKMLFYILGEKEKLSSNLDQINHRTQTIYKRSGSMSMPSGSRSITPTAITEMQYHISLTFERELQIPVKDKEITYEGLDALKSRFALSDT